MKNYFQIPGNTIHNLTPEESWFITKACSFYGLPENDIFSKKQTRKISYARQYAMYLMRKHIRFERVIKGDVEWKPIPFESIGNIFEKDHATVMHACRQVRDRIDCKQLKLD